MVVALPNGRTIEAPTLSFSVEFLLPSSEATVLVSSDLVRQANSHELVYESLFKVVAIYDVWQNWQKNLIYHAIWFY